MAPGPELLKRESHAHTLRWTAGGGNTMISTFPCQGCQKTVQEGYGCTANNTNIFNACTYVLCLACAAPTDADGAAVARLRAELEVVTAADAGDAAKLKAAFDAGVSPSHVCMYGMSLLAHALKTNLEAITVILDAGGDVNVGSTMMNQSLLHMCCTKNSGVSLDVVKALLARKPDLEVKQQMFKLTPLGMASMQGYLEMVQLLLEAGADKDAKMEDASTPLMMAAEYDQTGSAVALALIAAGADVKHVNEKGETAITLVSGSDKPELYSALLAAGADVNTVTNSGWTALHKAAMYGAESTKVLLAAGANPNVKTAATAYGTGGDTPLMLAATNGKLDTLALLITAGADVNATDGDGNTALIKCARGGCGDACARAILKLLEVGADASFKGKDGKTAAEQAEEGFSKELSLAALQGAAALDAYEAAKATADAAKAAEEAAAKAAAEAAEAAKPEKRFMAALQEATNSDEGRVAFKALAAELRAQGVDLQRLECSGPMGGTLPSPLALLLFGALFAPAPAEGEPNKTLEVVKMMIDEFEFDPNMTFTEPGYVSTYGCSVWSPFIRNWQQLFPMLGGAIKAENLAPFITAVAARGGTFESVDSNGRTVLGYLGVARPWSAAQGGLFKAFIEAGAKWSARGPSNRTIEEETTDEGREIIAAAEDAAAATAGRDAMATAAARAARRAAHAPERVTAASDALFAAFNAEDSAESNNGTRVRAVLTDADAEQRVHPESLVDWGAKLPFGALPVLAFVTLQALMAGRDWDLNAVRACLEAGADPNVRFSIMPLAGAVGWGKATAMTLLSLPFCLPEGMMPSIQLKLADLIAVLADAGADPRIGPYDGTPAALLAKLPAEVAALPAFQGAAEALAAAELRVASIM